MGHVGRARLDARVHGGCRDTDRRAVRTARWRRTRVTGKALLRWRGIDVDLHEGVEELRGQPRAGPIQNADGEGIRYGAREAVGEIDSEGERIAGAGRELLHELVQELTVGQDDRA